MPNNDDEKKELSVQHQVSDLILGSLKPRTGKDTNKWIADLSDSAPKDAAEAPGNQDGESAGATVAAPPVAKPGGKPPTIALVDQLFDFFQQYEFDFNKSAAGTDYLIAIERPTFVNESVRGAFGTPDTLQAFRGRLSTRFYTLLLRSTADLIEGWVLPAEMIFGFRADDGLYQPYVTILPTMGSNGEQSWKVNDTSIDSSQTRLLAKQLFGALVRHAKGEADDEESFTLSGTGTTASPAAPDSAPAAAGNLPASDLSSFLAREEQGKTPAADLQTLPASPLSAQQSARNSAAPQAATDNAGMDTALTMLNTAIASELEKLTATGAQAFAKQDMVQVEHIYKKTSRVKELETELTQFLNQWRTSLQETLDS
jgi:hypothetical protein